MRHHVLSLLSATVLLSLTGCSQPSGAEDVTYVSPALAYSNSAKLWTANGNIVPVCFMSETEDFSTEKLAIQFAVERQWGRAANLTFLGWSNCPTSGTDQYIKVQLTPEAAGADGVTAALTGMGLLGGPSASWSVQIKIAQDHSEQTTRLQYVAVHEFGHVLGFIHEQDRTDAPPSGSPNFCANTGTGGTFTDVTSYDPLSVMNYCGPNNGVLSPLDIVGIQKLYGRKPNGALVGDGGLCANIWGGQFVDGSSIRTFRCTGSLNDTWALDTGGLDSQGRSQVFFSTRGGNDYCALGFSSSSPGEGAAALAESCDTHPVNTPFIWTFTNSMLIGNGNLCLDTQGPFSQVVMRTCNGKPSQNWSYDGARFHNGDTSQGSQCLDNSEGLNVAGNPVMSWTCNGGSNQNWVISEGGHVSPQGSALVLDVVQSGTSDGTLVDLWTANNDGNTNQLWFIRTSLTHTQNGLVLDIGDGSAAVTEGLSFDLWANNGGSTQQFDYYP